MVAALPSAVVPNLVPLATSPATLIPAGIAALCILAALAFLAGAAISLSRWRHLRQADADQFRASLAGPIELVGPTSATEDADPFRAAVSGTECFVSEIEAQEYQSSGQGGGSWTTRESRTTTRPFLVDTAAGTIRVEPEGAELLLDTATVEELDGGEAATGRTARFLDAVGVDRSVGSVDIGITELDYGSRCRIRESRVDVGEEVYVAGTAVTNDQTLGGFGGPDAVVRAQPDRSLQERLFGFPFVVGDEGERAVRKHFFRRGLIFLGFGAVFGVVAAAALSVYLA